ncbi:hypothetical protein [Mesorhizobium sp. M0036]|uniref:hypothetical protein n=1 Tax=Mesorhizobium sp. M0036 TaxID=2956853 RepID=UPI00333C8C7C
MSGKVLTFPSSTFSRSINVSSDGTPESLKSKLVRAVRDAARDPKLKLPSANDPLYPAQYVDRLIAEAKRAKISQDQIRAALPNDGSVSIRHMERLRIDHTLLRADAKKKNWGPVSRKVRPYVIAIGTLATLLGRSTEDALYEAFRDTTFLQKAGLAADDPAVEFADLVQEMGSWLARKEPFSAYFADLSAYAGWFDATIEEFVPGERPALTECREDGFFMWHDFSPLPSIPILEVRQGKWHGKLRIESRPVADKRATRNEAAAIVSWRNSLPTITQWRAIKAEVNLYTQIGLAIGPLGRSEDIGPLWETRSRVEIHVGDRQCELTCDRSLVPLAAIPGEELAEYAGTAALLLDDGWHRVTGLGSPGWHGTPELDAQLGHWYDYGLYVDTLVATGRTFDSWSKNQPEFCTHWDRVNGETVAQIVSLLSGREERPLPSGNEVPNPHSSTMVLRTNNGKTRLLVKQMGPYEDRIPSDHRFVEKGARLLDQALSTGAIEEGLSEACARLHALLRQRLEERRAAIRQADQAMMARWQLPSEEPSEPGEQDI